MLRVSSCPNACSERKEMFDLTMSTTHFIYGYMASDKCFTLGVRSDDPSRHKRTFYHSYVSPFVFSELDIILLPTYILFIRTKLDMRYFEY